jgi:uncharacterized Tic20 family protein
LVLVAHLGILLGAVIVPAVIAITQGTDDDPWVRRQSLEALNFQIAFSLVWLPLMAGLIAYSPTPVGGGFAAVAIATYLAAASVAIRAGLQTWRGADWSYPLRLRLFTMGSSGA